MWRSAEIVRYESGLVVESVAAPGVRYEIRRVSLYGRAEIARLARERMAELEYHASGETAADKLAATELRAEMDSVYIRWGLRQIEGLEIDGAGATVETLILNGPEGLAREIAEAIRQQCSLSHAERKN